MPLTMERILEIRDECMADDVDVPHEAIAWTDCECQAFFESGGRELPQIMPGFEGAEIHAHYEMHQQRMESVGASTMMDALSAALFKTTGDEKFKRAQPKKTLVQNDVSQHERVRYKPQLKYDVPQFGGSTDPHQDDSM